MQPAAATVPGTIELSVVMPCLNEAETLASCIRTAQQAIGDTGIAGEVIVADNGSTASAVVFRRMPCHGCIDISGTRH